MSRLVAVLLIALASAQTHAEPLRLDPGPQPGPHPVGVSVLRWFDGARPVQRRVDFRGRPFAGERRRALLVTLFHPARAASGAPLTYGSLLALGQSSPALEPPSAVEAERALRDLGGLVRRNLPRTAPGVDLAPLITALLPATLEAPPAAGPFPLLVTHAPPATHAALAIHLASHGFVVASVMAPGTTGSGAEATAAAVRDLEFCLDALGRRPDVDRDRVGTFGFSAGGFPALLLAMRHTDVGAVATLESGVFMPQFEADLKGAGLYAERALEAPLLHVWRARIAADDRLPPFEALVHAPRTRALLHGDALEHQDLQTLGLATTLVPSLRGEAAGAVRSAFASMATALRAFFASHLLADPRAGAELQATLSASPWQAEQRVARPRLPTVDELRGVAREEGLPAAVAAWNAARATDPDAPLWAEAATNALGHARLRTGDTKEALAILTFNALAHANSPNAHDSLGDVQLAAGDKDAALASARRALALLDAVPAPPRTAGVRANALSKVATITGVPQFIAPNKPVFAWTGADRQLVLTGGFGGQAPLAGTWVRGDEDGWRLATATGPDPARGGGVAAYDAKRGRLVVFGGSAGGGRNLGDTWEWDGLRWARVATEGPSPRAVAGAAFDGARGTVVVFGGLDETSSGLLGDTWEWNGRRWKRVAQGGPAPRHHPALAYDEKRRRIVLFGGNTVSPLGGAPQVQGDTWEWDGKAWARVATDGPPARDHHGMAYDARRGRVVVFGGWNGSPGAAGYLGDVWEWDGVRWSAAVPPADAERPTPRGGIPTLTWDGRRERVLLFGGWDAEGARDDLWSWDGARWERLP